MRLCNDLMSEMTLKYIRFFDPRLDFSYTCGKFVEFEHYTQPLMSFFYKKIIFSGARAE